MEKWYSDNGDGTYTNPIHYTDYSDPDVIRVGDDYFMTASSFCNTPGLPVLHSRDLVNWKVISYGINNLPYERYKKPQHGCGVWAPAIRYYNNEFVIFFPMPDEGIFTVRTKDPWAGWSEPQIVYEGKGWIDPCPFVDEDGRAYMVNAFAKSRIGFKSVLQITEMSADLTKLTGEPVKVFDGNENGQITIEGPKLYKRNGWYYIFAPAGGVKQGWQTVLRSRNIFGPYEYRTVLEQKDTQVNGPHQGAWIDTVTGEDWFIHFQDVYCAGRIIHLQPLCWKEDWPVIGEAEQGEICGKPVMTYRKPDVNGKGNGIYAPDTSDQFDSTKVGFQWQWNANHEDGWIECDKERSCVILYSVPAEDSIADQPNLLLQKWPVPEPRAVTKLNLSGMIAGDECGIINMGVNYSALSVYYDGSNYSLRKICGVQHFSGETAHSEDIITTVMDGVKNSEKTPGEIFFKYEVTNVTPTEINTEGKYSFRIPKERVVFSYSLDGIEFIPMFDMETKPGRWVGVKCGIYIRNLFKKKGGSISADYFVFE